MEAELLKALNATRPVALAEQEKHVKAFIYGDWGSGKTLLACSSGKRTLLITSGDGGEATLYDHPDIRDNVRTVRCMGLSHIKAVLKAIEERHDDYADYHVVVVDTISSVCDQYLKNMVDNYTVNKDRHMAKPKSTGKTLEAEGMGDYKFLAAHMRDLAPVSIAAPVDVIWLSQEREPSFTDEAKGVYLTRPKMPEKAADAVAECCHVVGLLEKKRKGSKVTRTLKFEGSDRLAAKSRIKSLDDKTIDANEFWGLVEEWRNS
jgi:enamine deaminase RidA (YjgF/YER057c/UK114 family)